MVINKETVIGLVKTIQNLYLSDDIPWLIGYSGGKDSTAVLQLVWMSIEGLPVEQRKKPIHVMNTDTLVESPVVSKWVERSLEAMRTAAKEKHLRGSMRNIHSARTDTSPKSQSRLKCSESNRKPAHNSVSNSSSTISAKIINRSG